MQPVSQQNESSYKFDAFELDPVRRVLLRGGKAIALKPKAFETLLGAGPEQRPGDGKG